MASPALGINCPSIDELVASVAGGTSSSILGDIHIALLRLLQADAEECFAQGEGAEARAAAHAITPASHVHLISPGARLLEEAWAWGFDVDFWRAHLGPLTWPEVAREMAIAAGLGRRRPEIRNKGEMARMGREGEDVVVGGKHGKIELQLPARLGAGTVKGAAWLVLKDCGH